MRDQGRHGWACSKISDIGESTHSGTRGISAWPRTHTDTQTREGQAHMTDGPYVKD